MKVIHVGGCEIVGFKDLLGHNCSLVKAGSGISIGMEHQHSVHLSEELGCQIIHHLQNWLDRGSFEDAICAECRKPVAKTLRLIPGSLSRMVCPECYEKLHGVENAKETVHGVNCEKRDSPFAGYIFKGPLVIDSHPAETVYTINSVVYCKRCHQSLGMAGSVGPDDSAIANAPAPADIGSARRYVPPHYRDDPNAD